MAGTLFVVLGVVGALVPVLPATPFLLLAAACYARSSRRLYGWLFTNRVFGEYLRRYRDGEGLPLASKIATLVLLWITLGVSALLALPALLAARPVEVAAAHHLGEGLPGFHAALELQELVQFPRLRAAARLVAAGAE